MHKDPFHTLFAPEKLVFLPSCHSTNQVASDLLAEGRGEEGTVVITPRQTAGRGQRGNRWESEPDKNLTCSVILTPKFLPVTEQFDLTVITSLSLIDCLQGLGLSHCKIKWPNDIFINQQKIGGILIENTVRSQYLESAVLGIGLNINQLEFQVPEATSVGKETGKKYQVQEILTTLLDHLQWYYRRLSQGARLDLRNEYLNHLLWRNQPKVFKDPLTNTEFSGSIQGVTDDGRLIVVTGRKKSFYNHREIVLTEE